MACNKRLTHRRITFVDAVVGIDNSQVIKTTSEYNSHDNVKHHHNQNIHDNSINGINCCSYSLLSTPSTSSAQLYDFADNTNCVQTVTKENVVCNGSKLKENILGWCDRDKIDRKQLENLFAEENTVRYCNVFRLLKSIGITPLRDDPVLEKYFGTDNNPESSISLEQWISLVEHYFIQSKTDNLEDTVKEVNDSKDNINQKSSKLNEADDNLARFKEIFSAHAQRQSFSGRNGGTKNTVCSDKNNTDTASVVIVPHKPSSGNGETFLTGSEEMDVALLRLFIHCGAFEREGKGIVLFVSDFRNVAYLRQETLPPKVIVRNAAFRLSSRCTSVPPDSIKLTTGDRYLTLVAFMRLIEDELRVFVGGHDCEEGSDIMMYFPPTLCMVLAALAPSSLQRLCGANILKYLFDPSTVTCALNILEHTASSSSSSSSCSTVLGASSKLGNGKSGCVVQTTQLQFPSSFLLLSGSQHSGRRRSLVFSKLSQTCTVAVPEIISGDGGNDDAVFDMCCGVNKRSLGDSFTGSHLSHFTGTTMRARGKRNVPRFMESRPLDEISASIVARSKARKVIDELRKNAIPINRYGCFARVEYVQKAIFREANLDNDEDCSDDNTENGDKTRSKESNCFINRKIYPIDIAQPLLPGMYKMGGLGAPRRHKAHKDVFESLYRQRLFQVHYWRGLSRCRSVSQATPSRSVSQKTFSHCGTCLLEQQQGQQQPQEGGLGKSLKAEENIFSSEDRNTSVFSVSATALEQPVCESMTHKKKSQLRKHVMLANLLATRHVPIPTCSQAPFLETDCFSTITNTENATNVRKKLFVEETYGVKAVGGTAQKKRTGNAACGCKKTRKMTLNGKTLARSGSAPVR